MSDTMFYFLLACFVVSGLMLAVRALAAPRRPGRRRKAVETAERAAEWTVVRRLVNKIMRALGL